VQGLVESGFVPVVAPIAAGPGGSYNINADLAAGALAAALNAQKIVFLTNVPGLYRDLGDEGSLISEVNVEDCERLLSSGALSAGMNPKIASVVLAIRGGVPQAHILDGRILHALLLEVFTDEGIGTMVLP
jgi:acetylglutamate kinase